MNLSILGQLRNGLLLGILMFLAAACAPVMRNYQGHHVFNPVYLFYLESRDRDAWQKPDEVIQALALPPGASVADVGAGGGYFTEKLARAVGSSGRVYATDVQPVMIRKLQRRVDERSLTNVTVIHSGFDDPGLPAQSCDLAFFSSVYKEIDGRVEYMKRLRYALKTDGRVAILEYRPNADAPGPEKKDRLPESQVIDELEAAGYRLGQRFEFLPREYFLIFEAGGPGRGVVNRGAPLPHPALGVNAPATAQVVGEAG